MWAAVGKWEVARAAAGLETVGAGEADVAGWECYRVDGA